MGSNLGSYELTKGDWIAYGLLLGLTVKILLVENKDVTCPTLSSPKEECDARGGMPFSDTHPEPGDSPKILKAKVGKAMKHWSAAVKWRRSFVMSVVIMAGITFFVIHRNIPWRKFYIGVLVSYLVIFGYHNYYDFHVANVAEKRGLESLDALYEKMKRDYRRKYPSISEGQSASIPYYHR